MDLSTLAEQLNMIELDQFGLNRILLNLILQMFLKNNIDDPNDIMNCIAEYLEQPINSSIVFNIASNLNIMYVNNTWVWIE